VAPPTEPELPVGPRAPTEPAAAEPSADDPAAADASAAGHDDLDWRRPHPLTILLELGRAIRSILIAVVVVSGGVLDQAAFLETALLVAPFLAAVGRWYTTRYAIDDESVHLHHGLLWRTKQVLPRSNIQNVTTKASLLARIGSVVDLQISDASADGDIRLQVVSQDEADRLTTLLRSSLPSPSGAVSEAPPIAATTAPTDGDLGPATDVDHTGAATPDLSAPAPDGPAVERPALVAASPRALLLAELTAMSTLALAAVATIAIAAFSLIVWLEPDGIEFAALPPSVSAWVVVLVGLGGALFLASVSVVQRLLTLGGFKLWADPDRLRIRVGLLTEARIAARRERIQLIRVERDLLHRRIGFERVSYETADLEVGGTAGTGFLAPVAVAGTWRELATDVFGEVQLGERDLQPVSPLTVRRVFVRFVMVSVPMLALAFVHPALPIVIVPWLVGGWLYSRARYRELGFALGPDQFLVRKGVFFGRLTLVRLDKVQSVRVEATIFQRRLGLASLSLTTAGHGLGGLVSLPDLPRGTSEELLDTLARRAAETPIAESL
jgi:putative membrane protein